MKWHFSCCFFNFNVNATGHNYFRNWSKLVLQSLAMYQFYLCSSLNTYLLVSNYLLERIPWEWCHRGTALCLPDYTKRLWIVSSLRPRFGRSSSLLCRLLGPKTGEIFLLPESCFSPEGRGETLEWSRHQLQTEHRQQNLKWWTLVTSK